MQISGMPTTKIERAGDSITITQEGDQTEDAYVSFPIELAETIANEILRLAKEKPREE